MAARSDQFEAGLIEAAKVVEQQLDSEINRLENMGEDDLEIIRQKRLKQMKKQQQQKQVI